jgi:hypothetical protein
MMRFIFFDFFGGKKMAPHFATFFGGKKMAQLSSRLYCHIVPIPQMHSYLKSSKLNTFNINNLNNSLSSPSAFQAESDPE